MFKRLIVSLSLILFLSLGSFCQAYSSPGSPTGFVNDYAGLLTPEQVTSLNSSLTNFSQETSNEISVVTINSLEGETIETYANKLFSEWGIGNAKNDNGVLLLIAETDRRMRIEPGYGLEGALPDLVCNQIINNDLRPAFQAGNYYEGILAATEKIKAATKGEYVGSSSSSSKMLSERVFEERVS